MVPTLETARLRLRAFRESDLEAFAAMQADPEVMRHIGPAGATRTRAESWTGMAVAMGQWVLKGFGMWAWEERASGRFVGRGGILEPYGWPMPELGYALVRDAWGQGYAQEACRAALEWGYRELGRPEFASFIKPGNEPSRRTAGKLGAVFEGMTELMGTPCELWMHRRLRSALA